MNIPSNADRVSLHTSAESNRRIKEQIKRNISYYAAHPDEIDVRLNELDREWDIERTMEANAATISVASVLLGILVSRKWLVVPAVVGSFLLNHAIKGWCPPLPLLRRFGVRTQAEIERERYALKALRGDFMQIASPGNNNNIAEFSDQVMKAVNE